MRTLILKAISVSIIFLLSACNFPKTVVPDEVLAPQTVGPTQDYESVECAYMWANGSLPELSDDFDKALKEAHLQASGYAEAYGENCIDNEGNIVRFLPMETDFHIMLKVDDLEDKQTLGELIEQVLVVVAKFPKEDTPGPQPGYVGITFQAPTDELRLWFTQTDGEAAIENGLQGEELFNALQMK
jgi:hypothetical protein